MLNTDRKKVYLNDPHLTVFAWGSGKSKKNWAVANLPNLSADERQRTPAQWTASYFVGRLMSRGEEYVTMAQNAGVLTQTTLDRYLRDNNRGTRRQNNA